MTKNSNNDEELPKLLKVDDLAKQLRKSRAAIYAMNSRGLIPGVVRIGRSLYFRQDDVLRWLNARTCA